MKVCQNRSSSDLPNESFVAANRWGKHLACHVPHSVFRKLEAYATRIAPQNLAVTKHYLTRRYKMATDDQ